jgi:hypothetical protein
VSLSKLLVQSLVARARRRRTVPREWDSWCTVGLSGARLERERESLIEPTLREYGLES